MCERERKRERGRLFVCERETAAQEEVVAAGIAELLPRSPPAQRVCKRERDSVCV